MKPENEKTLYEEGQIGETVGAVSVTNSTRNTITAIASAHNVNKVFSIDPSTGKLIKKAKATICSGNAMLCSTDTPEEMIDILQQVSDRTDIGLCLGKFQGVKLDEQFKILTRETMEAVLGRTANVHGVHEYKDEKYAARLKEGIDYSTWILLDADSPPGMPDDQAAMNIEQRMRYLEPLVPGLSDCMRIELRASSARVRHTDDVPQNASHALIQVSDPDKIDILRSHIQVEMLMQRLSFHFEKHSKSDGSVCGVEDRTVFDLAVLHKGRLMFAAKPTLERSAIDAGYVVGSADIKIVNPDGGALDISKFKVPTKKKLKEYSKKTGSKTTQTIDGKSIKCVVRGKLCLDTKIDSRGTVKPLEDWIPDIDEVNGLRCETPFRPGSNSEAGWLHIGKSGKIGLYDHAGIEYPLAKTPPSIVNYGVNIPANHTCCTEGVFGPDGEQLAKQPVFLESKSRSATADDESWKIHVRFITEDGIEKNRSFPKDALNERKSGGELIKVLINSGLDVVRGKATALLDYLAKFENVPTKKSVTKTGWEGDVFVLPHEIINQSATEELILDDAVRGSLGQFITQIGALEGWKDGIKDASLMAVYGICKALTPPFMRKVGGESGGDHFVGGSSIGKTTLLQLMASVSGIGGDPMLSSKPTAILTWDATKNALIIRSSARNDIGVFFDELGTCDPLVFKDVLYSLFTGQSKGRATIDAKLQTETRWRLTLFSSGEIGVADFIRSTGTNVKTGQIVRMLDIHLEADGIEPLFKSAEEADAIKKLAITHCGHALPELIKRVPDLAVGFKDINPDIIGKATTPATRRARKKFVLALHAGYVASDAGIVPWTRERILKGVQMGFIAWHDSMADLSDGALGLQEIQKCLQKHEARFEVTGVNEFNTPNRLGWKRDGMFHFSTAGFTEACGNSNVRAVRRELNRLKFLHCEKDTLTATIKVNGKTTRVTSVKEGLLGFE